MPVPRLRTTTAVLALALIAGAPTGTALAASHVKPVAAKPAEAAKTAPAHHNYRAARLIDLFDIDGNGKVSVAEINGDQSAFSRRSMSMATASCRPTNSSAVPAHWLYL